MSGDSSTVAPAPAPVADERPPLETPDHSDVDAAAAALEAKFGGGDDLEADVDDAAPGESDEQATETAEQDEIPSDEEPAETPAPGADPRAAGPTARSDERPSADDPVGSIIHQLGDTLATLTQDQGEAPAQPAAAPAPPQTPQAPAAPAAASPGAALFSPEEINALKGEYGDAIAAPLSEASKRFAAQAEVLQRQDAFIQRAQRQEQARDVRSLQEALVWAKEQGLESVFGAPDAHFNTLPKHQQDSRVKFMRAGMGARAQMEKVGQFVTSGDGFKAVVQKTLLKKAAASAAQAPARGPSSPAQRSRVVPATRGPVAPRHGNTADADERAAAAALQKKYPGMPG